MTGAAVTGWGATLGAGAATLNCATTGNRRKIAKTTSASSCVRHLIEQNDLGSNPAESALLGGLADHRQTSPLWAFEEWVASSGPKVPSPSGNKPIA